MQDIHRRVIKTLKKHAPGMEATLVRELKHVILDFSYQGKTVRATLSKSPKNPDHAVWNSCAEICKEFGIPKPSP